MTKSKSYQKWLIDSLKDPQEAAEYLNAALEEDDAEVFLLALRNVTEAQGGMSKLARRSHLNRESLYRTLSRHGNPELQGLGSILDALGLKLSVKAKIRKAS